jgi:hypothetical protein
VWLVTTVLLTIGALVVAAVSAPGRTATPGRGLEWLLFVGSSVHVASTGWLYSLPDVRSHAGAHRVRYIWGPIGLVVGAGALAAILSPSTFGWLLLPYFAWQFLHFQKQNLGMAALAASSQRLKALTAAERRALVTAAGAGIAGLIAHPGLLQLKVDPGLGILYPVAATGFAAAVVCGIIALGQRRAGDRPARFCTIYLVGLFFSLPVFVVASPYAAVGGMTIAHGLQYLLLLGLVAAGDRRRRTPVLSLFVLFNVALLGGAALSAASHLHGAGPGGRLLFGGYLGAVMAHFVVDGGLWRMRDPFPRAFLRRYLPSLVPGPGTRAGILAADGSSTELG